MSSDKDKAVETEASETAEAPEIDPPPPVVVRRRGGGAAWLALLLAVAALGLSGWLAYPALTGMTDRGQTDADETRDALHALDRRLDEQAARVEDLQAGIGRDQDRLDRMDERLDERLDSQSGRLGELERTLGRVEERTGVLPERLDELERDLATRIEDGRELRERLEAAIVELDERGDLERRVDRDLRRQVMMLEAASLLRSGQDLAELAGDRQAALRTFRRARSRLEQIEDARLDQVRRSLAREIDELSAASAPDLDAELAVLERLGRDSRDWPLQLPQVGPAVADEPAQEGWRERVTGTFRSLVRVQVRDDLGRDEEAFQAAREQLRLRLVAAELALVRRDAGQLQRQLGAAIDLLEEWFDGDAQAVVAARAELARLSELSPRADLPALGTALEQLQSRLAES